MVIDKDKLPIKYHLEVHSSMEGYPTELDILYEMVSSGKKSFQYNTIKKLINSDIDDIDLKEKIERLNEQKFINTVINKEEEKYKIISHPWS